ncbi:MAG TPA: hypothetical protein VFR77_05285 [Steroidobacteraceae bacterium]|nr:hypothetical protein [Steroidobacteraceae bacterium]
MKVETEALRRLPWFAIAIALYPLLHIAAANPGQVEARSLLIVVGVAAAASIGLLILLRRLYGDWLRAGLGVAWLALLFFSYGPVNAMLARPDADPDVQTLTLGWLDSHLHAVQSAIWLLLLALGWMLLRRFKPATGRLASALNFASCLLLALALVQWLAGRDTDVATVNAVQPGAAATAAAPDIYFIVLDGYARADVLAQHYGYDNGSFTRGLQRRGFEVAGASESNYNWTFLSLASTLNMDYLPALLGKGFDEKSSDREATYRLLRDNRAAAFLRARGYRYVHLQSTWGGTGSNPFADDFRRCGGGAFRDDYLLAIADASWLRAFGSSASFDLASCHMQNFSTLGALAREPGPKFVLAHFVPPHHPYLFDREGRVLRDANLSNQFEFQKKLWEDRAAYVDQLAFVSRSVEGAVDRLIAEGSRPSVILLLSDHGPNLRRGLSTAEQYRVRLANLVAVRMPGNRARMIPDDVSNVNLLRIVLAHEFGADLPPLPDRHFVSAFLQPFDFRELNSSGAPVEQAPRSADNM